MLDLTIFDEQLRESFVGLLIEGEQIERIGPLVCVFGAPSGGYVGYANLAGPEGAAQGDRDGGASSGGAA